MPEIQDSMLAQFLVTMIFSGGAGYVVYKLLEKFKVYQELEPDLKRLGAWVLTVVFAWGSYGVLLWLSLYTVPSTPQDVVTTLFAIAAVALTSSQGFDANNKRKLRKEG